MNKIIIKISPLSKTSIINWSYGFINNPNTINFRTLKPQKGGLFCTKIFGPLNDYVCDCGFLKKYDSGIGKCNKCGVEYILSSSRRTRMACIDLSIPLLHYIYLTKYPYIYSVLINLSNKLINEVINYRRYIIFNIIGDRIYVKSSHFIKNLNKLVNKLIYNSLFKSGVDAISYFLSRMSLEKEISYLLSMFTFKLSLIDLDISLVIKRLKILIILSINKIKPIWFMVKFLPILPPNLRPLIILGSGKVISSGINSLYSNIISINNRLNKLIILCAPKRVIINTCINLQNALDEFFINKNDDNILINNFSGKQGLLRNNLLGKRVDFSARTIIVVEPNIPLYFCGVPYIVYKELLRPFLLYSLIKFNYTSNIYNSCLFMDDSRNKHIINKLLHRFSKGSSIILNRAPTLHRMNIQSFYPRLVNDKTIYINPLICKSFNADFDGDQMAIYLPLYSLTKKESNDVLLSYNNIYSPANGKPLFIPSQEAMVGLFNLTSFGNDYFLNIKYFSDINQAYFYYLSGANIKEVIFLKINSFKYIRTTIGRIIFFRYLNDNRLIINYNISITKSILERLIIDLYRNYANNLIKLATILNNLNRLGLRYVLLMGFTFSISDFKSIDQGINYHRVFLFSLLIRKEFRKKKISWFYKNFKLLVLYNNLINYYLYIFRNYNYYSIYRFNYLINYNNFSSIVLSGAKNIINQFMQLIFSRGLITINSIEFYWVFIFQSLFSGLSMINYFLSSYGSRKGLCDTSINTALSGYFTRKLVSVSRDLVILSYDCGSFGIRIFTGLGSVLISVIGRLIANNIYDNFGRLLFNRNQIITPFIYIQLINNLNYFNIRTPSKCLAIRGICVYCYGYDLSKYKLVSIGSSVGMIASQSLGEPGTQLIMRTFHTGGFSLFKNCCVYSFKGFGYVTLSTCLKYFNYNNRYYIISFGYILIYNLSGDIISYFKLVKGLYFFNIKLNSYILININIYKDIYYNYYYIDNIIKILLRHSGLLLRGTFNQLLYFSKNKSIDRPFILVKTDTNIRLLRLMVGMSIIIKANSLIFKIPRYNSMLLYSSSKLSRLDNVFEARLIYDKVDLFSINFNYLFLLECFYCNLFNKYKVYFFANNKLIKLIGYLNNKKTNKFINLSTFSGFYLSSSQSFLSKFLIRYGVDVFIFFVVNYVRKLFTNNLIDINTVHIEIIIKQLIDLVFINLVKQSKSFYLIKSRSFLVYYILGSFIMSSYFNYFKIFSNCLYKPILFGISKVSLFVNSFISTAAYKDTLGILFRSAINCCLDSINTIVGKIIFGGVPFLGTGVFLKNVYY